MNTIPYYPDTGDVFRWGGGRRNLVAVPGGYNREDYSSMSYDRKLKFVAQDHLDRLLRENLDKASTNILTMDQMKSISDDIIIKGDHLPFFEKIEGEAPYVFEVPDFYKVRRKTPKTITVYE